MMNRPRNLPADERRAHTVEAVVELAGTRNPGEITTMAIARHMGLTEGALFRHFPSKQAIWQSVMEWVAESLLDRVERAARDLDSPSDQLRAMFLGHIDFVAEHPGVPRMLFGELQKSDSTAPKRIVQSLIQRYAQRLQQTLEAGKACGELHADLDSGAAATLFIGTIQGLVMQSLLVGDMARIREEAPKVYAIYSRGIGARP
ncbi:MAG: TetR family transcriptional regulator [Dokdonella sp.]|jgi:AcrR family transcriptional regulator